LRQLKKKTHLTIRDFDVVKDKIKVKEERLYAIIQDKLFLPIGFYSFLKETCAKLNIPISIDLNLPALKYDLSVLEREKLRPYQRQFTLKAVDALVNGTGGLLVAPPAFGKSYILRLLVEIFPEAKIDIISRRRDVILTVQKYLNSANIPTGLVTAGSRTYDRITLYTAQSLNHSSFDADIVILDEAHELVTDLVFKKLFLYKNARILCLTATPDTRYDNRHKRLEALAGPLLFKVDYRTTVDLGLNSPVVVIWHEIDEGYVPEGASSILRKKVGIWYNRHFNEVVASIARKYYDQGKQVLVLVDTLAHVKKLAELLPEFTVCYGSGKKDLRLGTMTKRKRESLKRAFENRELMGVIATKIWSVGVSFNDLEVLIRADGTGSHTESIQIPGRVSRLPELSSKEYGIVVDFMFTFDSRLQRQALQRQKYYQRYGWTQILPDGTLLEPGSSGKKSS
jgi:superfamily II DNA or RNA helicase